MTDTIKFFKIKDPYGFMSNFSPHSFEVNGKHWKTSEHFYQAQKFHDPELQEQIRVSPGPRAAGKIGRDENNPLRPDWEEYRNTAMHMALLAKFMQNPDIAKELIDTGDATLVEHSDAEKYWADGGDGSGENMLGQILMIVRSELKQLRDGRDGKDNA